MDLIHWLHKHACDLPAILAARERKSPLSDFRSVLRSFLSLPDPEWPCLYMTYEATYGLKRLVFVL